MDPAHNLRYVEGSTTWAGVIPMALIGIARAFHAEITPYLSEYGLQLYNKLQHASIIGVLGAYPGLTWSELAKPQYPTPESIPVYVQESNQLIMGSHGTPTVPLFIGQGAGGELEGTPGDKPGIGRGDGVMIAGDVRTLAREYCGRGVRCSTSNTNTSAMSSARCGGCRKRRPGSPAASPASRRRRTADRSRRATRWRRSAEGLGDQHGALSRRVL